MNLSTLNSPLLITLTYHYDSLVDYVRRNFSASRQDGHFAREVVHDVCLALMDSPPTQQTHTPLAYLRQAIKHRAIDQCRSDQTRRRYLDYVGELPDDHVHDQDGASMLDFAQKLHALKQIIEALPPRQRQVFLLHRLHAMPQQQIADELNISRNMVTQHFTRAMATISVHWQAYLQD